VLFAKYEMNLSTMHI